MSEPKTISINDVQYVRADSVQQKPTKKQMVVLQRGWIVVGDVAEECEKVTISNCSVIRVWGTKNGLGELAELGPLTNTKLDKCPDVSVHKLSIVLQMNTNEDNWK